jgi:hypothetical protein
MNRRSIHPTLVLLALAASTVAGCADNAPYRTKGITACHDSCTDAVIEQHDDPENHETYDLAFVEFTERGNVFDRDQLDLVLEHVRELADPEPGSPYVGVIVVAFVHGWKHNASEDDTNVKDFRDLLRKAARLTSGGRRKVMGVYVGWRGASITLPGIEQITYWERKNVAEQVGKGGVTELLTRLEQIVIDEDAPNRNLYLVVGHSFGGAIVLSALNEVLLERVVEANPMPDVVDDLGRLCVRSEPFGHGVVLLNAAMEANEAFQLKEVVSSRCFPPDQDRLMHVITSDADSATGTIFKLGQWFGMLRWQEAELERPDNFAVHESEIDTTTIGHYLPFQTGQLCSAGSDRPECRRDDRPDACFRVSPDGHRTYISYAGHEECVPSDNPHHIPVARNEPLAFIQTDGGFIGDHNDVFTDGVSAYLAAILAEARHKRGESGESMLSDRMVHACADKPHDFGACLHAYDVAFAGIVLEPQDD